MAETHFTQFYYVAEASRLAYQTVLNNCNADDVFQAGAWSIDNRHKVWSHVWQCGPKWCWCNEEKHIEKCWQQFETAANELHWPIICTWIIVEYLLVLDVHALLNWFLRFSRMLGEMWYQYIGRALWPFRSVRARNYVILLVISDSFVRLRHTSRRNAGCAKWCCENWQSTLHRLQ